MIPRCSRCHFPDVTAHSTARGWDLPAYRELGAAFMIRRHEIDYLGQLRLGDVVWVDTWVASWKQATSLRRTTLRRATDGRVVAEAATTWALVRVRDGRPVRIPDELRAARMGDILDDFAARGVAAEQVHAEVEHVWWASLGQELRARDRAQVVDERGVDLDRGAEV